MRELERGDVRTARWDAEPETSVTLIYADAPVDVPDRALPVVGPGSGRHVSISQTTKPGRFFERGSRTYWPSDGKVIVFGRTIGKLKVGGIYVALEASSEALLVSAARALRPYPG